MNPLTVEGIVSLSKGNPGALTVLTQLVSQYGDQAVSHVAYIDELRGSELWLLYKDINKQDIHATYQTILRGPDAVREALIGNPDSSYYRGASIE